jgi:uncharacterized protein YjbI with pentapeptide repeats
LIETPAAGDAAILDSGQLPADLSALMTQSGVDLSGTVTVGTRVSGADWKVTTEATQVYYVAAQQAGSLVVLDGLQAPAVFDNAFLNGAVLDNGNFAQVSFRQAVWMGNASTAAADFEGADFSNAIIASSTSQYPSFSGAKLFGVAFTNAVLVNVNLQGIDFSAAGTDATSFYQANLFQTAMAGADMDKVDLTGAIVAVSTTVASPSGVSQQLYGAPLFVLPPSLQSSLVAGPPSQSVLDAFENAGYPLPLQGANIDVVTAFTQWTVSAPQPNWTEPDPPVLWYQFTIQPSGNDLIVYGTDFLLCPPVYGGTSRNLNATMISASAPAMTPPPQRAVWLTNEDMAPTTVCPNGTHWDEESPDNTWDQDMLPSSVPTKSSPLANKS